MPLINMPDSPTFEEFAARQMIAVDTPVIQPAEPFLDMAGEDLRRRIFMTENERGESLCLRPEFTIPVTPAPHRDRHRHAEALRLSSAKWVLRQRRGRQ